MVFSQTESLLEDLPRELNDLFHSLFEVARQQLLLETNLLGQKRVDTITSHDDVGRQLISAGLDSRDSIPVPEDVISLEPRSDDGSSRFSLGGQPAVELRTKE